jgi:hypothetical protein
MLNRHKLGVAPVPFTFVKKRRDEILCKGLWCIFGIVS